MGEREENIRQALTNMLVMQDRINSRIGENWTGRSLAWYRAVWVECAELMDHQGYKWWKEQRPDLAQIQLEVVDIWHFGMSAILVEEGSVAAGANHILREMERFSSTPRGVLEASENLASHALVEKAFSMQLFLELMEAVDLSFEQLHGAYVRKNVLNFFRQDHGYKEGSYRKQWRGREDNEHMVELASALHPEMPDYAGKLYQALEQRYRECCS